MSRDRLTIILGIYLSVCVGYQIALHFWRGGAPPVIAPRFGVTYLLFTLFRPSYPVLSLVDLALVPWLLIVAISCFMKDPLLRLYVASEILFSIPVVLWISSLLFHGSGDVFGRFDGLIPFTVLLFFSVMPVSLAIWSLARKARKSHLATR